MSAKKILTAMAILCGFMFSAVTENGTVSDPKDGKESKYYRNLDGCCYRCSGGTLGGAVDGYWGTVKALRVDAVTNMAHIKFICGKFLSNEKSFQMGNHAPDGMDPKTQYVLFKKSGDSTFKVYFLPKDPATAEEFETARKAKKAFYYDKTLSPTKIVVDKQECQACKGTGNITEKENTKTPPVSGKNTKVLNPPPKTVTKTTKCTKCDGTGMIPVEWDPHVIRTLDPQT